MQTPRQFWKEASAMCRRMRGRDFLRHAGRRWAGASVARYLACNELLFTWDHARNSSAYPNLLGDPLLKARHSRPHAARMLRVLRGKECLQPWETPDLAFSDPRLRRLMPAPEMRRAA